ncbi:MAG: exo-alpha-sialidase [Sedimentisphaeraceae bacterium JB056]
MNFRHYILLFFCIVNISFGTLLVQDGKVLGDLSKESSYSVAGNEIVLNDEYGTLLFKDEFYYGSFAVKVNCSFLSDGKFIVAIGADEFIFDSSSDKITSRGHTGVRAFKDKPLSVKLSDYVDSEKYDFVFMNVSGTFKIMINGKDVYENEYQRDTIGQLCIYSEGASVAIKSLEVEGEFEAVPQKVKVFTCGENGYAYYRIPAIIRAKDGTLLAFAEGRHDSLHDNGNIDQVIKRSFDNGKSWSDFKVLHDNGNYNASNPCPILDEKTGRIHYVYTTYQRWGADEYAIYYRYSDDSGASWSQPVDVKQNTVGNDWGALHPGPGHGIMLDNGRLLASCWVASKEVRGKFSSAAIFSDDNGKNWQWAGTICDYSDECMLTRIADNGCCMFIRPGNKILPDGSKEKPLEFKKLAFSDNGGNTWTEAKYNKQLPSVVCQGSIITDVDNDVVYAVHPASGSYKGGSEEGPLWDSHRAGLTVSKSKDKGKTWQKIKLVCPGRSAYSDVALLSEKELGILFEGGRTNTYKNIYFTVVSVD